ncbi:MULTISPECIES: fasciclin domain-containing protein [Sphingobacterium]|uniref:Fasciclin domain-containing protein n=1 Tax=Sphingobacterium ginsenosidimutans TaxID=687845 RepID=A0ABP8ABM5_9SPHI|nr:fasciclin domain-containing protein [Sphingobacterium sp. E70]ULT26031.1 fasciclin domain-containing protein [Sphingobacterium sp. E70]
MKKAYFLPFLLALILSGFSCSKNYYDDSGIHQAKYDGNMLQYLQSKGKDERSLFDTLLTVINLAGLENTIANEQITFFAPTDPSIGRAIRILNKTLFEAGQDTVTALNEIDPRVWKKMLQGYMIKGNLGIVDFPQVDTMALNAFSGRLYQTLDDDLIVNIGTVFHDLKNDGVTIKYQGPRQLLFSYIPDMSRPKSFWKNGYVATSNIEPTNGRLHVLRYIDHQFGFSFNNYARFSDLAIEYGIKYKEK